MRREDLFHAIGMVDEKRLARCEKHRNPSQVTRREDSKMNKTDKYTTKPKRNGMPKVWLIAAVIAAMVTLMGCAWIIHLTIAESPLFDYPLIEGEDIAPSDVHLSVSNVTSTDMQVHLSIEGLAPGGELAIYLMQDGPFILEKKTANGWEALPLLIDDPEWDADEVLTDGNYNWYVSWSSAYGILDSGTYRYTATVVKNSTPVSVEFEVVHSEEIDFIRELQKILNGEFYYIRYKCDYEFGSFENLTRDEQEAILRENNQYTYEFWKSGEDLMQLIYRNNTLWIGMLYKDGIKYTLDHEGDDRTKPIIGWSPWPDMNMSRLTEWVNPLTAPDFAGEPAYAEDGSLKQIALVKTGQYGHYHVDATSTETWEIISADAKEISLKFAEQNVDIAREFSWEHDKANYPALDMTYINTTIQPIHTASEAITQAIAECTVEYDKIIVYRDEEAGMWKVEFQIQYGYQGYQYIYLNNDGITQMISGAGSKVPEWQDAYPNP